MSSEAMQQQDLLKWWKQKPVWVMLFLGFSAGIPLYLIFASLSLWLREAGVNRSTVTYFSWAVLGYSFKFVWAPLVDRLPLPLLTRLLGRRRGWLLLSQSAIVAAIILMANIDPAAGLTLMAFAAVLLGFSSATQDIVIDAYRIEAAVPRMQAMLSSTYVAGYRVGMIVAGAGALYLAQWFGSTRESYSYQAWHNAYLCMAATMVIGIVTTLLIKEPDSDSSVGYAYPARDYVKFFLVFMASIIALIIVYRALPDAPVWFHDNAQHVFAFLYGVVHLGLAVVAAYLVAVVCLKYGLVNAAMVHQGYQAPILDFFERYGKLAVWVLLLVGFYRVSDIVMGVITNVFYQDMGYSKREIAGVTKVFGVIMTISGAFLGGLLALRIGVMRALMLGAVLVASTNLLFMWLVQVGDAHTTLSFTVPYLCADTVCSYPQELVLVIIVDNLSQGFAIAAFIAWLSSLTNVSFTATQYAIFSSLMTLLPKFLGGYSGTLVNLMGYSNFFLFASLLGVPVIVLIYFLRERLSVTGTD
ncbi:MAG: MFS transporter [Gammaproteobacteria bacterium]|nr:MFS transporter [Gammaproteobacteria bacterium]